jgi:hypothetical protein
MNNFDVLLVFKFRREKKIKNNNLCDKKCNDKTLISYFSNIKECLKMNLAKIYVGMTCSGK